MWQGKSDQVLEVRAQLLSICRHDPEFEKVGRSILEGTPSYEIEKNSSSGTSTKSSNDEAEVGRRKSKEVTIEDAKEF